MCVCLTLLGIHQTGLFCSFFYVDYKYCLINATCITLWEKDDKNYCDGTNKGECLYFLWLFSQKVLILFFPFVLSEWTICSYFSRGWGCWAMMKQMALSQEIWENERELWMCFIFSASLKFHLGDDDKHMQEHEAFIISGYLQSHLLPGRQITS